MTGTIEWNDPAVIEPPDGYTDILVAHVDPVRGETVEPGRFYGGRFFDPFDGVSFDDVRRWAMMPEFPQGDAP